jgi:hypothetical protein
MTLQDLNSLSPGVLICGTMIILALLVFVAFIIWVATRDRRRF